MAQTDLQTPLPQVQHPQKGRRPISWRKDTTILMRLLAVAEIHLRGGSVLNIANSLGYSQATAKRDLARVRILWRERSLDELINLRSESLAMYRLVQAKAWAEFSKKASPHYLRIVVEAQSRIDDIEGNQAPKEIMVNEIDIEAIRKKRWGDMKDLIAAISEPDD